MSNDPYDAFSVNIFDSGQRKLSLWSHECMIHAQLLQN